MYIPNVNSILAAGLALTGGSGLMKKRTFFPSFLLFLPFSLPAFLPLLLFVNPPASTVCVGIWEYERAGVVDASDSGAGLRDR